MYKYTRECNCLDAMDETTDEIKIQALSLGPGLRAHISDSLLVSLFRRRNALNLSAIS